MVSTGALAGEKLRRTSRLPSIHKMSLKKDSGAPSKHIYGREVAKLTSGDHFGEKALLQREGHAIHTVRTNDMVELLVIDEYIFSQCLHPYFEGITLKRAEFLAGLEWFRNWTPHMLRQLTFMLQERRYQFEECLYKQGMLVSGIWFVQSGSVKLSTQMDSHPPEELLDKIDPPKDYLPEILAEDSPEKALSVSSIFSNTSHRSSIADDNRISLVSPLTKKKKQKESVKKVKPGMMGYVIRRPNPKTNIDLCILGPGDILCENEAVCKLRKHLFNAVCESDVVVYELNKFYFELMFERWVPRILHQMSRRAQQRIEIWDQSAQQQISLRTQQPAGTWGEKCSGIRSFGPLMTVLEQTANKLEAEGAHKVGRKKPLYVPEMLAWTAIRGLGKTPMETSVAKEVPVVRIQTSCVSSESGSSQVAPCPPTPLAVSPFEPRMPDFERMCSLMRFTHPRLNTLRERSEKSMFDSPLPSGGGGHLSKSNSKSSGDSIPIPTPYLTKQEPMALSSDAPGENEAKTQDKMEDKSREEEFAKRFPTANDPKTLASIKLGLLFGKNSAPAACGCSSMQDAKERLNQTKSQAKRSGSKSAGKGLTMPILTTPTLRSISLDRHMQSVRKSAAAEGKEEDTDTASKAETRVSFSMDNELTDIPKEYSRLCGQGEWHSQRGAGGCAVCRQHYRDMCSDAYTLPFMKTMMKVIENRTSSLLTKYVWDWEGVKECKTIFSCSQKIRTVPVST